MGERTRGPVLAGRAVPLAASAVTLVLGLAVHAAPGLPGADKAGDALYAAFVLLLLWLVRPRTRPAVLVVVAGTWCLAVELLQLTSVPANAAARVPLTRLVLGSGFDPLDLVAYAVGLALAATVVVVAERPPAARRRR